MPVFTLSTPLGSKSHSRDFWLVNGCIDWSFVRGPVAEKLCVPDNTPIRLHVGHERKYGALHIYKRQRRVSIQNLLRKHNSTSRRYADICQNNTFAAEYAWLKLCSPGTFYSTEDEDKSKIVLASSPSSLMVMKPVDRNGEYYFSIITLYPASNHNVDGERLGRYNSQWVNPDARK